MEHSLSGHLSSCLETLVLSWQDTLDGLNTCSIEELVPVTLLNSTTTSTWLESSFAYSSASLMDII